MSNSKVTGSLVKGIFQKGWGPVWSSRLRRAQEEKQNSPGTDDPLGAGERWGGSCRVK